MKFNLTQAVINTWQRTGSRFLPFADVATADLPLSRLLRLSLFQISVGMAMVLLVGTLNRVMIVELKVPASLVSIMVALPLIFAPLRALIGFRSDNHRSALGWRRVPYMWMGSLLQFGGLAIMPFALLVLARAGQSAQAPLWVGYLGAAGAFLLVGAGLHTTQTVGLALATDLVAEKSRPKVVGLMYVMLMVGMIASALLFGHLLAEYSPGRLIQVIQGAGLATLIINIVALWKQEPKDSARYFQKAPELGFTQSWALLCQSPFAVRRLVAIGLGTMAFTMGDVLLEPYGGEILNLAVGATTSLTATLAIGGLIGFVIASKILGNGGDPFRMASVGAFIGLPAFILVIVAAPLDSTLAFAAGIFLIGLGAGLFSHGTLTSTMNYAPPNQSGLALGAWGAVQASATGVGVAVGGVIRDSVAANSGPINGYVAVYAIELALLVAAIVVMLPMLRLNVSANKPQFN